MRVSDFDTLTLDEFGDVLKQWRKEQRRKESTWLAGMRLHAAIVIAPHCSKPVAPRDLFDIPEVDDDGPVEKLTKEEKKQRFEELKKICGYE